MKIAVVGVGGVGGYFGGRLAQAGYDVTFVARGATLEALRTKGLRVESIKGDLHLPHVKATEKLTEEVDVVLMAVKAWQLEEATKAIASTNATVVPMQNGIDAPTILANQFANVLGGLCAIISFIVEPGHIKHPASEPTVMFGELDNTRSERAERLLEAFTKAGVNAEIPRDIHRSMWAKFLFITPLSAMGAITRVPVGAWRASSELRDLTTRALEEIVALARAQHIDLGEDAVAKTWERYDDLAPEATASLQRDIMQGKRSELEAQLGAVVRVGRQHGIATPVNAMLYHCLLPQERQASGNAGG
ncbi:MAG TPA: 2-dehydropantoate 2-reductase [Thermoanaerobaculia bacterium]|nr:2-dehydropantoate 2-reductase [Thermoanaerobaculia bacterium]